MKLKDYVKSQGSQEAAAHEIGISVFTLNRWMRKGQKQRGILVKKRLEELGIKL